MKRFQFRLERLERLRRHEQRDAAARLAEATADLEARRSRRETLEAVEVETLEMWRAESTRELPLAGSLREIAERLETLRVTIASALEDEDQALERLAARRVDYLEKSRACRVLEKLRMKRWRRWREGVEREEQRQLDELHLLRTSGGTGRKTTEARR